MHIKYDRIYYIMHVYFHRELCIARVCRHSNDVGLSVTSRQVHNARVTRVYNTLYDVLTRANTCR